MRSLLLLATALLLTGAPITAAGEVAADPQVTNLRTNHLTEPLAIPAAPPQLSWQLSASRRGLSQQRYEIHVASSADKLQSPDIWNSGQVASSQSVDVPYGGPALTRYSTYHWTVRIWDETGTPSAWSPPAKFETGALQPTDWAGDWIGADDAIGPEWADYTIDTDVSVQRDALGVYLRGRGGAAYMWQLNTTGGVMRLRPHVRRANGEYELLANVGVPVDLRQRNNLRITVAGQTITTWINGQQVDQRNRSDVNEPGLMGFRVDGPEEGVVHRLKVTSAGGAVLIDSAFPLHDQTFPDGTVRPEGGLLVKKDVWVPNNAKPLFRKDIELPAGKTVVRARLHAAVQGIYELRINGTKAGDHELAPGWTDYRQRIQTQTYDVTSLLRSGAANTIGAELAGGWFTGQLGVFSPERYGTSTALTAQLRVTYDDGTTGVFATDATWRSSPGPVRAGDLLHGETYDARAAQTGWDKPGYPKANEWRAARLKPSATALLATQTDQPVRVTQQLAATAIRSNVPGTFLYDLGQNMVGVPQITLIGTPGQTVRLRFAEVLDKDGNFYTANLRTARATDYYTFASTSPETYRPRFTFHGFRYVEISGLPTAPPASALKGLVIGTDGKQTSRLTTSSTLVNKLHSNITWGQRGNFLSIPTDTPARDERLGWTGDINVFARTAVYNQDSQAFLSKWLRDLRLEQRSNGSYPSVAPTVPEQFDGGNNNAGWADAGVNLPWTLWQAYGDTGIIREQFDSMKLYVDSLATNASGFIRPGGDYNDWLSLESSPSDTNLIGTAFYAKSARQLSQMATAIGRTADADRYQQLYSNIRNAFAARFIAADGRVSKGNQTDYILAITNDLVPADRIEATGNQFAANIAAAGHLKTGFLGVDGLLPALSKIGRSDLAYLLLQRTDYPSWGYEIGKGATTIWERWDSIKPDGSFGDVAMNSFNHYAYGAVGQWMYATMAGVSAAEPGFRKALIAPTPGPGLTFADFAHETPYGEIVSRWDRVGTDGLKLAVTVPGNSTAVVRIPASDPSLVTEGGVALSAAPYVTKVVDEGDTVAVTVAAGTYLFAVRGVEGASDYVDLGDAASESGHRVSAAPSSGTGAEAGRTRRYSGLRVPGSWFEFDLRIQAGQPFTMRLVETFDLAQVKDYEVRINGVLVHHRVNNRAKGGLDTYQFPVDDPALLGNPTVRVRIQHNVAGSGYDPSLADVWALPR